ncbi:hypothetical protein GCM10009624_11450 [Gordonia sinesedis]
MLHRRSRVRRLAERSIPGFVAATESFGLDFDPGQRTVVRTLSTPVRHGYYLWGAPGRGKTRLADMYFAAIPSERKRRYHFHEFFAEVQDRIAHSRPGPRRTEAAIGSLLDDVAAVFFDEFHVHDVADGMYLTTTLRTLLDRDVLLLTTSNYAPTGLLPNPLFHRRVQPAIDLIGAELEVVGTVTGRIIAVGEAPRRDSPPVRGRSPTEASRRGASCPTTAVRARCIPLPISVSGRSAPATTSV